MADIPILFSTPMVKALLAGQKTTTRRVLNRLKRFGKITEFGRTGTPGLDWAFRDRDMLWHELTHDELLQYLPYQVGDRLYVRESFCRSADGPAYMADYPGDPAGLGWKPSIHMPKAYSRLTLLVTDVKIERLQGISREDAIAEGLRLASNQVEEFFRWPEPLHERLWLSPIAAYRWLWDQINAKREGGKYSWDANPWVVAPVFEVHHCNIDHMEMANVS